jgi:hypothetical protein
MISLSNPFSAINPQPILSPEHLYDRSRWVKLICGASYQDLPRIRNLALVYALAGVDCIDMAADPAVIAAVREGVQAARSIQQEAQAAIANLEPNSAKPKSRAALRSSN